MVHGMEGQPRIVAALAQSTFEELAAPDTDLGRRVRARMDPRHVELLQNTSRVGWLPVEVDVDLTESLFVEAGPLAARAAFRKALRDALSAPLLRPLVSAAGAVLGSGPAQMLKWAPRIWNLVYRDAGDFRVTDVQARTAVVELRELPDVICESRVYLDGTAASLLGYFDTVDHECAVRLSGPDPVRRTASFELRWCPREGLVRD